MSGKQEEFDITGMHCAACVARVERVVSRLPGVADENRELQENVLQIQLQESDLKMCRNSFLEMVC